MKDNTHIVFFNNDLDIIDFVDLYDSLLDFLEVNKEYNIQELLKYVEILKIILNLNGKCFILTKHERKG